MTDSATPGSAASDFAARVASVHERLPELLPAHEFLGSPTTAYDDERFADRKRGDYVYVQGRGDRLHAFLCVDTLPDATDVALLDTFSQADANWRWLIVPNAASATAFTAEAARRGLGLIVAPVSGPLSKLSDASPNPGVFIKAYPVLRKAWRTLASW